MDQQIIDHLKSTYPEVISSDQLYKICRSSKRTVRYYLENNFIPCIDSGKKTRRYQIRLDDVIAFLFEREENPALYKPRQNYYAGQKKTKRVKVESRTNNIDLALLREFLLEYLSGSFAETVRWWLRENMKTPPEDVAKYFMGMVNK